MNQIIIPGEAEDTGRVYINPVGAFVVKTKYKCGHQSAKTWAAEPSIYEVGDALHRAKATNCPIGDDCAGPSGEPVKTAKPKGKAK